MYELKKIGIVFTSKFDRTGPSSYKKIIYRVAVSQRLRKTDIDYAMHHYVKSFSTRVPQNICRASAKNRGINSPKNNFNIVRNFKNPSKFHGNGF
jgi:hypothetical protein